jgi:NADP-dependent 3-hydroxy acid dehydrogenase YdfG/acyl carrier protein
LRGGELLCRVIAWLSDHRIEPLPYVTYPIEESIGALSYLQRAEHIGKVVWTLDEGAGARRVSAVKSKGTYVITGGLSGIGYEVCGELIRQGAHSIALLSRREVNEDQIEQISLWQQTGVMVKAYPVDVSDYEKLKQTFASIEKAQDEIRGVFHGAGLLSDGLILNQSCEQYQTVYAAKVTGGWNLHQLTQEKRLDHFVVFSSMAAIMGPGGQSNHAAANVFLDQLIAYRQSKGLAGLSINWGAWSETGSATHLFRKGSSSFVEPIDTDSGIEALMTLLSSDQSNQKMCVMPINGSLFSRDQIKLPNYLKGFASDGSRQAFSYDQFKAKLNELGLEDAIDLIQEQLKRELAKVLQLSDPLGIDIHQGFFEMGLDSLMALEYKNRLQTILGQEVNISPQDLFDYPNITDLSKYLMKQLGKGDLDATAEVASIEIKENEAIAIVSLDCRFPGGADNPDLFWSNLESGRDGSDFIPEDRWDCQE